MAKYDYLGTVRIARMLQVSPRTVANWIDADLMGGERLPSGRRRVHRDVVAKFAQERGMTLHPEVDSGCAADKNSLSS